MAKTRQTLVEEVDIEVFDDGKPEEYFLSAREQKKILKQIESEYQLALTFNEAKRKVMLNRLKLYNNQRRNDDAVGDPLMFTVFNTIHASLYDDRLMVNWRGRSGQGDEETEENLNALSEYDYDLMEKPELDYLWNWDAEFFGRGLVIMMDFEREKPYQCPVPEYTPATTWIRDPKATSVNGDMRGRGSMRFGGREIGLSYWELKEQGAYFNIDLLQKEKELKSMIDELREAHRDAQGLEQYKNKEEDLGKKENYEFNLLEWYTHYKGKKYLFTLGNNRRTLTRYEKIKSKKWPIIDRAFYPMASDWDGVSIPDVTEDKQRARAILLNLGLKSAKKDVLANYLYDSTKITNKNHLNFKSEKFIPVKGPVGDAMVPVQKSTAHQYVSLIMEMLDSASQRAMATPEIQQGAVSSERRTLGELELVSSKVDTRYSMTAKVYGWSERLFWLFWYYGYKTHFKEGIDEKVIRIQGALAPVWRTLMRDNIIALVDPDVKIESKVISEARRLRDQRNFNGYAAVALQEPTLALSGRRFILKKLGKLAGATSEELSLMFPKTGEELHAEDENEVLNIDKWANVSAKDDHLTHLLIHAKANQTPNAIAHIRAHKKLLVLVRMRPDLFPPEMPAQIDTATLQTGQGTRPAVTPTQ